MVERERKAREGMKKKTSTSRESKETIEETEKAEEKYQ